MIDKIKKPYLMVGGTLLPAFAAVGIHTFGAGNQLIAFWRGLEECDLLIAFKLLVKLVIIF